MSLPLLHGGLPVRGAVVEAELYASDPQARTHSRGCRTRVRARRRVIDASNLPGRDTGPACVGQSSQWWSSVAPWPGATTVGAQAAEACALAPVTEPVIARVTESVGQVTSEYGFGSGWVAAKDTVITNLHVAQSADMFFTPPGRPRIRCYRAAAFDDIDLAALKCPTGSIPPLAFRRTTPAVNDSVLIVGYPDGIGPTPTTGIVLSRHDVRYDTTTLIVSAKVIPGSSGSPITDNRGEVIAVCSLLSDEGTHGVKVAEVQNLLDEAGYLPATKLGAEWRLRIIRTLIVGLFAAALGAYLQWRSGYPGVVARSSALHHRECRGGVGAHADPAGDQRAGPLRVSSRQVRRRRGPNPRRRGRPDPWSGTRHHGRPATSPPSAPPPGTPAS